ncbi:conserved hypothetical protein [Trichormus variabilis ATCC 29413]|uniref:DUF1995 domain-containing protein n=2 Tax=Anabaena variabilis TaxID=264691 RepID=Q3M3I7_TRIV2|nr:MULTISPECIES: DUF1995 family protein [Nostocaceae]ABA24449.1 conserved hypothetical protein [Trichormus variabilis ATCC 29413]MBC1257540.1 DUF1995 family protein [Trichormus variabilis V5]MBC1267267.1 DUF1995 family protein [Trichormus variabilis FSR]MBC1302199.1 DUF1995 family protein [Trichormus variabilis N2B]MBC1310946.1 DUF1995 family protein [Trichormus variabilis PNB]
MPELPNSLEDAIAQSREATKAALADGCHRIQVELLFPELKFMPVAEQFLPCLVEYESRLKVFFADAGAAALARRDWKDAPFQILDIGTGRTASIQSKIQPEDEIFLFISPTSVEVPQLEKICEIIGDRPAIFLNPRLEDAGTVGIGYTARQTRERFLNIIQSCYYLRPIDDETALFRSYPGDWEIWVENDGNWAKIANLPKKPSGDEIDLILMKGQAQTAETDAIPARKPSVFKSLQRFIKALNR